MSDQNILHGIMILCKPPASKKLFTSWAEHDAFGIGNSVRDYTEEERKELKDLGWFVNNDQCESPTEDNDYTCMKCESCLNSSYQCYV